MSAMAESGTPECPLIVRMSEERMAVLGTPRFQQQNKYKSNK